MQDETERAAPETGAAAPDGRSGPRQAAEADDVGAESAGAAEATEASEADDTDENEVAAEAAEATEAGDHEGDDEAGDMKLAPTKLAMRLAPTRSATRPRRMTRSRISSCARLPMPRTPAAGPARTSRMRGPTRSRASPRTCWASPTIWAARSPAFPPSGATATRR